MGFAPFCNGCMALCLSFFLANVWAETTANVRVSATISRGCALQESSEHLNFGTHPSMAQGKKTAQIHNSLNSWRIECAPDMPVSISFGQGESYDGQNQSRRMSLPAKAAFLPYRLFFDPNYAQEILPDSPHTYVSTAQDRVLALAVYGVVDLSGSDPNKKAGTYTDRVLITVKW